MEVGPGLFKVDALPAKSAYELDQGHAVLCLPTKARGGRAQARGGLVIATDPLVEDAGVEVGFDLGGETMRAPDVSILRPGAGGGWVKGAPALALEGGGGVSRRAWPHRPRSAARRHDRRRNPGDAGTKRAVTRAPGRVRRCPGAGAAPATPKIFSSVSGR